jgi:hypothetical protein
MESQFDPVASWFIHHGVMKRSALQLLGGELDLDSFDRGNLFKGSLESLQGRNSDCQVVKTDVLASIERVGSFICLPESEHDVPVREKVGRVGLDAANLGVSEGLEKSKGRINISHGESDVRNSHGEDFVILVVAGGHAVG